MDEVYTDAYVGQSFIDDDGGDRWLIPEVEKHSPGDYGDIYWNFEVPTLVITRRKRGKRIWWAPWRRYHIQEIYPLGYGGRIPNA